MPEELREQVRILVQRYGSYEALAHEIGVSWVTVHRWVKGKTNPSKLATRRIKEVLRSWDDDGSPI